MKEQYREQRPMLASRQRYDSVTVDDLERTQETELHGASRFYHLGLPAFESWLRRSC
jgi:hypothetical protein